MGTPRVAVLAMDAVGHRNPLVAVTQQLVCSGAAVHTFASRNSAGAFRTCAPGVDVTVVKTLTAAATGSATKEVSSLAAKSFLDAQDAVAVAVRAVTPYRPDVIVHDCFDLRGLVVAAVLGVPRVALFPVAGLRALGTEFARRHHHRAAAIDEGNDRLLRRFGVDVLAEPGCTPVLFPSSLLTLVAALPEQEPLADPAGGHRELDDLSGVLRPALRWVGPCVRHDARDSAPDRTVRPPRDPRTCVLVALGTNIGTFHQAEPVGGLPTGRRFVQSVMDLTAAAFGDLPTYRVVVSTSGWTPVETMRWPDNFEVHEMVAQQRVLARDAHAFITHHGLSSVAEAVRAQVPMVSFPGYGDQLANALFCRDEGVAVGGWDLSRPSLTCSPDELRDSVRLAVGGDAGRAVRHRLAALWRRMDDVGGARLAAELIIDAAAGALSTGPDTVGAHR